jgi:hypothetical protein
MLLAGLNIIVCHKTVPSGGCANFWVILTTWGGFLILWSVMFVLCPDYDKKPMSTLLMNTLKYSTLAASDQQEPEDTLCGSHEGMKSK